MSLNRYNPQRDKNEPEIVTALEKAGYIVTRNNGAGIPDLLVIKPHDSAPLAICRSAEDALAFMADKRLGLIEVKLEKTKLNKRQREWWANALATDSV